MPSALIASVGGTINPLIKTIIEHKPSEVFFFCSQDSVEKIGEIKAEIKRQCQREEIGFNDKKFLVDDVNDLVHCYSKAQAMIQEFKEWGIKTEDTIVDYTGGTKTMSVALALATIRQGYDFSYVGGNRRTKEGLGIVIDGTEQIVTGVSPWSIFAIEELRRIADLFNLYQFRAAEIIIGPLLQHPHLDERLKNQLNILQQLCQAYSQWDRFIHKEAVKTLKLAEESLYTYVNYTNDSQMTALLPQVQSNLQWLQQLQDQSKGFQRITRSHVSDLVANAARRAEERKFDDAVARLYRALEMHGQVALAQAPLKIESSGNVPLEKIPTELQAEYTIHKGRDGQIKLPLYATFRLLAAVKQEDGLNFMANWAKLEGLLNARNESILAHGKQPITESQYQSLYKTFSESMGFTEQLVFPKLVLD